MTEWLACLEEVINWLFFHAIKYLKFVGGSCCPALLIHRKIMVVSKCSNLWSKLFQLILVSVTDNGILPSSYHRISTLFMYQMCWKNMYFLGMKYSPVILAHLCGPPWKNYKRNNFWQRHIVRSGGPLSGQWVKIRQKFKFCAHQRPLGDT